MQRAYALIRGGEAKKMEKLVDGMTGGNSSVTQGQRWG